VKLDSARIDAYLADPKASRAALIFGEDAELVRDRVRQLTVSVAGSVNDPFRVSSLSRDGLGSLDAELGARSLIGGRRVVLLTDITDAACGAVQKALAKPSDGFLIVESGGLPAKSKLRGFFEAERDVVSIACFPLTSGEAVVLFARVLKELGVEAEADALAWAQPRLALDRARVRGEANRVALFVEPERTLTLEAALRCLWEGGDAALDDAVDAIFAGDARRADMGVEAALLEGATPVGVLMGVLAHVSRLHRCAVLLRSGVSEPEAMRSLRPPVFFRRQGAFTAALRGWSVERLTRAAGAVAAAELGCKQTGSPADLLVRNVLLRLSRSSGRPDQAQSR